MQNLRTILRTTARPFVTAGALALVVVLAVMQPADANDYQHATTTCQQGPFHGESWLSFKGHVTVAMANATGDSAKARFFYDGSAHGNPGGYTTVRWAAGKRIRGLFFTADAAATGRVADILAGSLVVDCAQD